MGTFTVLAVPLLVGLSGRKVPSTTWAAAVVALIGMHTCFCSLGLILTYREIY